MTLSSVLFWLGAVIVVANVVFLAIFIGAVFLFGLVRTVRMAWLGDADPGQRLAAIERAQREIAEQLTSIKCLQNLPLTSPVRARVVPQLTPRLFARCFFAHACGPVFRRKFLQAFVRLLFLSPRL